MAPTASAARANIASLAIACRISKPSSFLLTISSLDTLTFSNETSDALNPSTVGKFSLTTPSALESTINREIPFSSV